MPTYRFHCAECGHEFRGIYKINETKAECPECKSNETERLMSRNVGVSYVGRGFTKALKRAKKTAKYIAGKDGG